jgi:hypothetical protein
MFVGTEVSESLDCDHISFISFCLLGGPAGGVFALLLSPGHTTTVTWELLAACPALLRRSECCGPTAAAVLGEVNASNPLSLMLLLGTLLADLKRLGVSWQVLCPPANFPTTSHTVTITCILIVTSHTGCQGHLGGGIAAWIRLGYAAPFSSASTGWLRRPLPLQCSAVATCRLPVVRAMAARTGSQLLTHEHAHIAHLGPKILLRIACVWFEK